MREKEKMCEMEKEGWKALAKEWEKLAMFWKDTAKEWKNEEEGYAEYCGD